jgi:hypothetical protein
MLGPFDEQHPRRRSDAVAIVVGLAVLATGMAMVRGGTVPAWERRVFHAVNDLPEAVYPALWPSQQAGALAVGVIVAVLAALLNASAWPWQRSALPRRSSDSSEW